MVRSQSSVVAVTNHPMGHMLNVALSESGLAFGGRTANLCNRSLGAMAMHDRSAPPLRPVLSADERGAQSDAELAAALCRNQPWARREIWDRYSRRVRAYLSRALWRPAQEVDDLVQEVFLRVFTRRR